MSRKYKFYDPEGTYFLSTAVVCWIDVFTRSLYKEIIVDSLRYCVQQKGLVLYAYVIMSNHIHLIISKQQQATPTLSDIVRDFKEFTATNIIKAIKDNRKKAARDGY